MAYQPPVSEVSAVLFDVLKADERWAALSPFAEVDKALALQVLDGAATFVGERIAPLNRSGDEAGCRWQARSDGQGGDVTTPAGFREAYAAFWQEGWGSLSTSPDWGGQGLPAVLDAVLYEWLVAGNHAWTMAPGLLHGAYECLLHHGSDALREVYLGRIATGEWLATMCLTEPHAGSDLGLVNTRAVPHASGHHVLSGQKIFISGGDHDLTDNIVHLVLARLPDSPPGPKGLSLFLAPKFLPDGSRNAAWCDRIEEKMGLHGSPTCVMRFEGATGWLVGQPGRGLAAMFLMMNAARLHVALQGIAQLDAAHQIASHYALERRQMRAPGARHEAGAAADVILRHPAMQRVLDTQKAWVEGGRLLAYETGLALDEAQYASTPAERDAAQRWCSLATPILKAMCTDQGFVGASACLQVLGGHGYVREWGIEQIVRDSRVAMIYEGTNEIQAVDLLLRKVLPDGGQGLLALMDDLRSTSPQGASGQGLHDLLDQWQVTVLTVIDRHAKAQGSEGEEWANAIAQDFLRLCALGLWTWALSRLAASDSAASARWQRLNLAWWQWVMPQWLTHQAVLGSDPAHLPSAVELE